MWNAIGGLLLIILAIEVVPGLLKRVSRSLRYGRESKPDTRALADAYENADWVGPYYAVIWDLRVNWAPHVGGIMRAFSEPGLNIDNNGLRRTWNATPIKGGSPIRIHAYGGSTMMGFGVRDDWTVPSLLSKKLNDAGHQVDVVNFGQPTYTATQAFIAFTEQFASGTIADVTIFLDGLNEAITAEQNGCAGTVFNAAIRADEFNLMQPWRRSDLLRHALDTIVPRTMRRVRTLEELLRPAAGNGTQNHDKANHKRPKIDLFRDFDSFAGPTPSGRKKQGRHRVNNTVAGELGGIRNRVILSEKSRNPGDEV